FYFAAGPRSGSRPPPRQHLSPRPAAQSSSSTAPVRAGLHPVTDDRRTSYVPRTALDGIFFLFQPHDYDCFPAQLVSRVFLLPLWLTKPCVLSLCRWPFVGVLIFRARALLPHAISLLVLRVVLRHSLLLFLLFAELLCHVNGSAKPLGNSLN